MREQELPEYSEEFVRAYLGYESKAEFEEDLRRMITEHYMDIFYESVIGQVWPVVFENTALIKYPEKELKKEYDSIVDSYASTASAYGVDFESYISLVLGITEEEFYEYAQNDEETAVKSDMICYAIARAENITITEEEYVVLAEEYVKINGFDSLEALEAVMGKEEIREAVLFDKVYEFVADNASMTYLESFN